MNRHAVWVLALAAAVVVPGCARDRHQQERLTEVYTPTFVRVPPREPARETLQHLAADWRAAPGARFRADLTSVQGAAVAGALTLLVVIGMDLGRAGWRRSVDLLLLVLPGVLLFDVMRFFDVLRSPTYLNLLDWVFTAVVAASLALLVRALVRSTRPLREPWQPRPGARVLVVVATALLALNVWLAVARPADDAGFFVNLGAQRLRERGRLPYGDPLLTGTPGAAYAPVLYAAHVPFQWLLAPEPVNPGAPDRPVLGAASTYLLPPPLATRLCTLAFHLAGVLALFAVARRLADARVAWAAVVLYCGSLAVLGVGGYRESVAGITFVSHIAPASTTLLALAAIDRPALSGVLLALAAGVGFYPAFLGPAWLGYYWDAARRRRAFLTGVVASGTIMGGLVLALSSPAGDRGLVGTILYDTLGHHTDPAGYGSSPFGFWGQKGGVRATLATPLVGGVGLTTPAWLLYFGLLLGSFFLARRRSPAALALVAGAVAIGATLVKPHATGTYLAWYYPLVLLGFLVPSPPAPAVRAP